MGASLFVVYSGIRGSVIDKLKNQICIAGKSIKELTLKDHLFHPDSSEFQLITTGVYIFFEKTDNGEFEFLYVGKCSSRSFIERVPAHFDGRDGAWFHSFIKNLKNKDVCFEGKAYKDILYELFFGKTEVFITFIPLEEEEACKQAERYLRAVLNPSLNSYVENSSTKNDILDSKTLDEHLRRTVEEMILIEGK